ncbi:hypothetical protein GW750_02990 [bacterium]|nr:hypothetical protein [bacterium]
MYSFRIKESVQTNTSLFQSSSCFVRTNTHVNTGENIFSITAYSTLLIHVAKSFAGIVIVSEACISGNATYSLEEIHLIEKLSFSVVIVRISLSASA